jgi:hypothetical protein
VRFSLERPLEAARHYQLAQRIAERLVKADPANDMARLDLSRAFSREGLALAASQPARALELMKASYKVAVETSSGNHSGLELRFDYLTSSVDPLVQLGRLEEARTHLEQARALSVEMKRNGVAVVGRDLLKAQAIYLLASGNRRAALAEAQRHLALLPKETRPVLSENHPTVEALERIQTYAAGVDSGACVAAAERQMQIWRELRTNYSQSEFVRGRAERVEKLGSSRCVDSINSAGRFSAHGSLAP